MSLIFKIGLTGAYKGIFNKRFCFEMQHFTIYFIRLAEEDPTIRSVILCSPPAETLTGGEQRQTIKHYNTKPYKTPVCPTCKKSSRWGTHCI